MRGDHGDKDGDAEQAHHPVTGQQRSNASGDCVKREGDLVMWVRQMIADMCTLDRGRNRMRDHCHEENMLIAAPAANGMSILLRRTASGSISHTATGTKMGHKTFESSR